ncbi:MAG: alpha/beta hydrolase [Cellulomonadaceae bacterium]|nr:alpha/beta hydrolase [Cellulomonadaceae bacterium]
MHCQVGDVRVHYTEHGDGLPFVALHGAGVDHREIAGALEPALAALPGVRRIYPDLPGMGGTTAPARLRSNDDVVEVLLDFIDRVVGDERFLVGGHSLGGYLARAVAARRPDRVAGLALLCPAGSALRDVPPHSAVRTWGDPAEVLEPGDLAGFEEYFVIRDPETARSYRDRVIPGIALVDGAALERIFSRWVLRDAPGAGDPQAYPTVILAGRQDSAVGWAGAADLMEVYPRASLAVVDGAGHALLHEQPEVVAGFLHHWLARCRDEVAG